MARNTATQPSTIKTPDLIAWQVVQKGENAIWNKIGASWQHKDKKGMTLQLDVLPIGGRIVLRTPLPANRTDAGKAGQS